MTEASQPKRTAFFIAPIGENGSPERQSSDLVLNYVVRPACAQCGLEVYRADEMTVPGDIPRAVLERLVSDDLVVADLTGANANVFYELAVRHCVGKPFVMLATHGTSLPFDVKVLRTVFYGTRVDEAEAAVESLKQHIASAVTDGAEAVTPLTGLGLALQLKQSTNPLADGFAEILSQLAEVKAQVSQPKLASRETRRRYDAPHSKLVGIEQMLSPESHVLGESIEEVTATMLQHVGAARRELRDMGKELGFTRGVYIDIPDFGETLDRVRASLAQPFTQFKPAGLSALIDDHEAYSKAFRAPGLLAAEPDKPE